jgi:hypothetical protein
VRREKLKPAAVVKALKDARGLCYLAARALKVHPNTIFNYAKRHKQVQEAIDAARAEMLDVTENKLFDAISAGEPWAVTFALKNLGKDRGYVERVEQTGKDGGPVEHAITIEDLRAARMKLKELEPDA